MVASVKDMTGYSGAGEMVEELTKRLTAPRRFVSEDAASHVTTTQIVCGDCDEAAGLSWLPHKTFLTSKGCCSDCGGRSYALAAKVSMALTQTARKEQRMSGDLLLVRAQEPEGHFEYAN
jgi:hypothetical protein